MTPKEKAQKLVNKMLEQTHLKFYNNYNVAKLCALIAVDELISYAHNNYYNNYWKEVKQEIEKL